MIIRIVGEQEWIKTAETTVSGATRVYVSWAKSSVQPEQKFTDVFVANTGSQVISATPVFTPSGALAE